MAEERVYTIPLRKVKECSRYKRAPRAIRLIRQFLEKHTKSDNIKLDESINHEIWYRGIEKPPSKVRVKVSVDESDQVVAELLEWIEFYKYYF